MQFVVSIEALMDEFPYDANTVFNYDETRVFVADEGGVCIEKVGKERAQQKGVKGRTIGTLLTFICANGTVIMSVWIYAGKKEKVTDENDNNQLINVDYTLPEFQRYPKRGLWPRYYAWTETGYSNSKLHDRIMGCFCNKWEKISKSCYCFVFGDQLGSHKSANVTESCLNRNILSCMLPANTSHFLQPLDNTVFARFKQVISNEFKSYKLSQKTLAHDIKMIMYETAYHAEDVAFTNRVIKRSFCNTGIYPWNSNLILAKAQQNAGNKTTATAEKYIDVMKQAADIKMHPKALSTNLSTGAVKLQSSVAFTPFEIMEVAADKARAKQKMNDEKKKRKKDAEEVAVQKTHAKEFAMAKRAARKCAEPTCKTISRYDGGAKSWKKCINCNKLFCPNHHKEYNVHVKICILHNDSDSETNRVEL